MTFEQGGRTVSRPYGEFGVTSYGPALHLVTFAGISGALSVIGSFGNPQSFTAEYFERMVTSIENRAVSLAARDFASLYVDEASAYVRSRPEGCRSPYMDLDEEEAAQSADDICNALAKALPETDAYRAARTFEAHVPHLTGDMELIEMLNPVLDDFHNVQIGTAARFERFVAQAASEVERVVCTRSPFIAGLIEKLKTSSERAPSAAH